MVGMTWLYIALAASLATNAAIGLWLWSCWLEARDDLAEPEWCGDIYEGLLRGRPDAAVALLRAELDHIEDYIDGGAA